MNLYENTDICDLILLCREHNDEAFDEIVRRYTPMMRKVILSFDQTSYEFSELLSEACVALHTAAQRYDTKQDEVTFGLFARICIRNRIVDLIRASSVDRGVSECDVEQLGEEDKESFLTAFFFLPSIYCRIMNIVCYCFTFRDIRQPPLPICFRVAQSRLIMPNHVCSADSEMRLAISRRFNLSLCPR